jgi:HlyD family secretion protein
VSKAIKTWVRRLVVLAVTAGGIFLLRVWYCAPEPVEVQVLAVARGRVETTVTNSKAGTVRSRRSASLSPESSGRVVEIRHREGSRVQAGDLLLKLDDAHLLARLQVAQRDKELAEANAEQARAAEERALREVERHRALAEDAIVSEDVLDQFVTAHRERVAARVAAEAAVRRAEAAIALVQTELDQTVVTAPFDGVVAELQAEIGEWITPSPPLLPAPAALRVIDTRALYVSAPMDEVDSARLAVDQAARITVDSHAGTSFPGRVVRIAPFVLDVEEQNRTVEVEVEFEPGAMPPDLLPGTSADVEIILDVKQDALRIPTSALLERDKALVLEDGRLEERRVRIGMQNWDWVEVLGGLAEGELVVRALDREEIRADAPAFAAPEEIEP